MVDSSASSQPVSGADHDFSGPTFNVIVGRQPLRVEQFSIQANLFMSRSKFFRAARKPEWLSRDPHRPIDLSDEDPAVFQTYVECVYRGPERFRESPESFNMPSNISSQTLQNLFDEFGRVYKRNIHTIATTDMHAARSRSSRSATIGFTTSRAGGAARKALDGCRIDEREITVDFAKLSGPPSWEEQRLRYKMADPKYVALIKLYMLADMLQDVTTVNMVVDAVNELFRLTKVHPGPEPMTLVYKSLPAANPLRLLLHDLWAHETDESYCPERLKDHDFPYAMLRELAVLYANNAKQARSSMNWEDTQDIGDARMCNYHQHDTEHPICSPDPEKCICSLDLEESDYAISTD